MAKKNPPANNAPAPSESSQEALFGSNIHPATLLIADHEYQLGDFVREAFTVSGLSVAEWNALPEAERDQLIDHAVVELGGPSFLPEEQTPPLEPGDLVECAVLYDSVYGKHDDIIELPRAQADAAHAAGFVDTHPHAMKAIRAAKEAKASA